MLQGSIGAELVSLQGVAHAPWTRKVLIRMSEAMEAFSQKKNSNYNSVSDRLRKPETFTEAHSVLEQPVIRKVPITEKTNPRSRNSLYLIADQYLDFWYRFVDPSRSLVARRMGARLWGKAIAPALDQYVSFPTFERAARQYLWRALSAEALHLSQSGENRSEVVKVLRQLTHTDWM